MSDDRQPTSVIPEIRAHLPMAEEELDAIEAVERCMVEKINAVHEKTGGTSMLLKLEIAALALMPLMDQSVEAAEDSGLDRSSVQNSMLDLVIKRAREIWGQGGN